MNSCVLMAEIVQQPQLRYTPEQTALTEMLVQFPGLRAEDPPATLKVVGWGNLAQEIQQHYHQGDRVIIEGRLNMHTVERPEGFKEKRAELTVQRIHSLGADVNIASTTEVSTDTDGDKFSRSSTESRHPERGARDTNSAEVSGSPRTPVATTATNVNVLTDSSTPDAPAHQSTKHKSPTYPSLPSEEQDIDDIPF